MSLRNSLQPRPLHTHTQTLTSQINVGLGYVLPSTGSSELQQKQQKYQKQQKQINVAANRKTRSFTATPALRHELLSFGANGGIRHAVGNGSCLSGSGDDPLGFSAGQKLARSQPRHHYLQQGSKSAKKRLIAMIKKSHTFIADGSLGVGRLMAARKVVPRGYARTGVRALPSDTWKISSHQSASRLGVNGERPLLPPTLGKSRRAPGPSGRPASAVKIKRALNKDKLFRLEESTAVL